MKSAQDCRGLAMFYPVFLELNGRPVLVVGGGNVAERKVQSLLDAGASVTVVSPEVTPLLQEQGAQGKIRLHLRRVAELDFEGVMFAISATDDPSTQKEVARWAASRKVLVNTVDQPALCDFIVPAVVRRGDVTVAISTSGSSPALAAELRGRIEGVITENVSRTATLLGSIRGEVHERFAGAAQRKDVFEKILRSGILEWIGECDDATALARTRRMMDELT
jgi:precorrin-2 dehydrogenase / sirohydrochlorin ferrochelatase